jgi:TPR repeat protein
MRAQAAAFQETLAAVKAEAKSREAAAAAAIESLRTEARQLARDNAAFRTVLELRMDVLESGAVLAAMQTKSAELKQELSAVKQQGSAAKQQVSALMRENARLLHALAQDADRLAVVNAAKVGGRNGMDPELQKSFRFWMHVAEQKDSNSHALLGLAMRYEIGMGFPMSPSTALVWYRKAADKGCPHARKYVEIWNELGRRTDVMRDIKIAADRGSAVGLQLCG